MLLYELIVFIFRFGMNSSSDWSDSQSAMSAISDDSNSDSVTGSDSVDTNSGSTYSNSDSAIDDFESALRKCLNIFFFFQAMMYLYH